MVDLKREKLGSGRMVSGGQAYRVMNTAAIETNWVGLVVNGKFPLQQWLGGSQHSAVFLTAAPEARKAAIKLVPADPATAETLYSRWQATMALSHPHLARLYDAGICEIDARPLLYVVMELAEEDLSQVIPSRPITAAEAGEMLPPLVDALSFIHAQGLVHGHIKPSNIMAVSNQLKLSTDSVHAPGEFGAKALEAGAFDAPESASGAMLPPADVWSLGVMLVTALTQHPPVWKNEVLVLPDAIPTAYRAVARECLRRDPAERCTPEQIKVLLRPPSIRVERFEEPGKRFEKPAAAVRPKRSAVTPIVAGVIGLALLAGIGLLTRPTPAPPTQTEGANETWPAPNTSARTEPDTAARPPVSEGPKQTVSASKSAITRGAVAEQVLPDVPVGARNTIRGTVRVGVRVSVDADGKVTQATLDSAGPSRYFANLALQAARSWKFKAPQIDRKSVPSEWLLRFHFGRDGTQVVPEEVNP
jgi:TonB family protein